MIESFCGVVPNDLLSTVAVVIGRLQTPCLEWQGAKSREGYGILIRVVDGKRKNLLAHRCSHELFIRPIMAGNIVLHECDNRPCINPEHLFQGTRGDNIRDMILKRRHAHLDRYSFPGLSVQDIIEIQSSDGSLDALAERYGVSRRDIHDILNGCVANSI